MATSFPLHPSLESVKFLLGTWAGEGEGTFPSITPFRYGEEVKFWHTGKPVIAYAQRTWKLASKEPMHAESGYLRPKPDGTLDFVIAQGTGMVEVQKGNVDRASQRIATSSSLIGNATKVQCVQRDLHVLDDFLEYQVQMATTTLPLQPHLKAKLRRVKEN
eukprot:TRINITY_DN10929_c0_g2_i1.p2 TRINITY_DN10929_c0_g2~~TRINITY_DN10929_c0_g2_i1.p2  ORF type:complete len:161 (-),score=33.81 TRINITY_DN10929_c0_g2_i1:9-491(-)